MPVMIKENKSVLFVHIPKCGGSTFEKSMRELGWRELLSIRGLPLNKLNFMNCTPQHMHKEMLITMIKPSAFTKIITIVRNPFDRFVSEYFWQLKQGITDMEAEDWIQDTLNKYKSNNYIYDNHIRPQSEFVLEETEVFKLEDDGILDALTSIAALTESEIPQVSNEKKTLKNLDVIDVFKRNESLIYDFYEKDYIKFNYCK